MSLSPRTAIAGAAISCWLTSAFLAPGLSLAQDRDGAYVERARMYREQGDPKAALIELKNALRKNPDVARTRRLRGETYLDLGDPRAAEQELRRALELGMVAGEVSVPLGEALLRQHRYEEVLDEIHLLQGASSDSRAAIQAVRAEARLGLDQVDAARREIDIGLALSPGSPRALLALARVLLARQDIGSALGALKQAVEGDPGQAEAWGLLGDLHWFQKEFESAEAAYTNALEHRYLDQADRTKRALIRIETGDHEGAVADIDALEEVGVETPDLAYARGLLAFRKKDLQGARGHLAAALQRDPNHLKAAYFFGATQLGLRHYAQAEVLLQRVLSAAPDAVDAAVMLGVARTALGDYAEAEKVLRRALAQEPRHRRALQALSSALKGQGRLAEAEGYLGQAIDQDRTTAVDHKELAVRQLRAGNQRLGLVHLRRAGELDPDLTAAIALRISELLRNGQEDAAMEKTEELLEQRPDDADALALAGIALFTAGRKEQSVALLERALEIEPGLPNAALNLAKISVARGETEKARGYYEQTLARDPTNQRAGSGLDELAALEGGPDGSEVIKKRLKRVLETSPDALEPRLALARIRMAEGENLSARVVLSLAPAGLKGHPRLLEVLGEAELASGEVEIALATLDKLVGIAPESAYARYLQGMAYLALEDREKAEDALVEGLRIDPDPYNLPSSRLMTNLLSATPDLNEKAELVDELKRIAPEHPQVLDLEARLELEQGHAARAIEIYRQILDRFPHEKTWLWQIAKIQWRARDWEAYIATLDAWVANHADDPAAHAMLAKGYRQLGQPVLARTALEKVVALAPDDAASLNNLAWLLREQDPPRALEYARKAHVLAPDDPAVQDTLGVLLLRQGETVSALELLDEAAAGLPGDPAVQYHHALGLSLTGRQEDAVLILRSLIKKEFSEGQEARALLEKLDGS